MKSCLLTLLLLLFFMFSKEQSIKWETGRYYTTTGQIVIGLISKETKGNRPVKGEKYILFKADNAAKKEWINLTDIKSFVILTKINDTLRIDSFIRTKSFYAEDRGYIKVIFDNPTKLYSSSKYQKNYGESSPGMMTPMIGGGFMMGGSGRATVDEATLYLYGTDPDNLSAITRSIFMEAMCTIMADEPEVVDDLKNNRFKYEDLVALINYYDKVKRNTK